MKGISHKQATQWIHRRLDGLLTSDQIIVLNEHLASCAACHAHAAQIDSIPAELQSQFHARWDHQPGPSQSMIEQVTARSRRIPLVNRISSGVKMAAGAATLIVLALLINSVLFQWRINPTVAPGNDETSEPASINPAPPIRYLAFASDQSGNSEIYTVRADGGGLTNLTYHPAYDSNPVWSPDGRRIAFESDRDGFMQIYWMNADGSDVVQLTYDKADHYLPMNIHGNSDPWSPDGNKLLFLGQEPGAETSTLYSLDVNEGTVVTLATGTVQFNNLAWSPDGRYIGYVLNDSPTPDDTFVPVIYVVSAAGGTPIAISKLMPQTDTMYSPFYYWARDSSSIVFIAYRHLDEGSDQWIAYEAAVKNQQLIERATSSTIMEDWWEGTALDVSHGPDLYTLTWQRSDGTFNTFKPLEVCDLTREADFGFLMRRSPNGSQVINVACPNKELWFYYASPDGSLIKPLMDTPIASFTPDSTATSITWSSDDRFIAVTQSSPEKSSLYILNVSEPSAQPVEIVISEGEFYTIPSWRPTE